MGENSPPPSKRGKLSSGDTSNKDDVVKKFSKQTECTDQNDSKIISGEPSRRENILLMRLANKEQEVQEYAAQISHIKKVQEDAALLSLRQANLDPGVNLLFGKMREELQQTKDKLEQAQSELSAWKFTPDSQNGKKLISRCRTLIAENQELGRQLSQGKSAQLEAELALQKKYSEELKASQDELNEFVIQLDEEVEGMQSTIQVLQQQLAAAKRETETYKTKISQYENQMRRNGDNESKLQIGPGKTLKNEKDRERNMSVSRDRAETSDKDYDSEDAALDADAEHRNFSGTGKQSFSDANGSSTEESVEFRTNYDDVTEGVSLPGTPSADSDKDDVRSDSETNSKDRHDYTDGDSDSWSRNGDDWEDRTKDRYNSHSSNEDVDHQDNTSHGSDTPCDDADGITVHISSVSPSYSKDSSPIGISNIVSGKLTNIVNKKHSTSKTTQNTASRANSNYLRENASLHTVNNSKRSAKNELSPKSAQTRHTNLSPEANRTRSRGTGKSKTSEQRQKIEQGRQRMRGRREGLSSTDAQGSKSCATYVLKGPIIPQNGITETNAFEKSD